MDYKECIEILYSANSRGTKLGLKNMQEALSFLNNPQNTFPAIHVAGTNGKGSVVTKIAAVLSYDGLKVGLYTSPDISSFCERIQINGKMIAQEDVTRILNNIFAIQTVTPTFFEYATLLAFSYFAEQKVDVAVLETGLGGRLDATNVCRAKLSVITSISLDHTEILGETHEEIALEKAGIIKEGIPVVIGPRVPCDVIRRVALEKRAELYQVEEVKGNFELENRAVAERALRLLQKSMPLSDASIQRGLEAIAPCRFQVVDDVILDVAHNPDGIEKLIARFEETYPDKELVVVCGFSQDKDVARCIPILTRAAKALFCVEAPMAKAMPVDLLLQMAKQETQIPLFSYSNLEEGIRSAMSYSMKNKQILLICGSFFIMSQATRILGIDDIVDDRID